MTWMTKKSVILAICMASTVSLNFSHIAEAEPVQASSQVIQAKTAAIESITAANEGESAEMLIKLSSPATYTSYKTTSPLRLVIDLSQVSQGAITAPIAINKGNFKVVSVNRYDTEAGVLTRVEIELVKDLEAVLSASPSRPGELRISFPGFKEESKTAVVAAAAIKPESAVPAAPAETPSTQSVPAAPVIPTVEPKTGNEIKADVSSLRKLSDISVKNDKLVLAVEGGVGEFKAFRLNKPERYVLDLYDVKSILASRLIQINKLGVSTARLGLYPEKVRVVFDSLSGGFPEAAAVKTADGIEISISSATAVENPNTRLTTASAVKQSERAPIKSAEEPVKSEPTVKAATAPKSEISTPEPVQSTGSKVVAPATVEMIDFQVIEGITRISVKLNKMAAVDAPTVSAGFVTLNLKGTILPKQLQRSLESKGFISPVLRVTPLVVKSRKGIDTKIRIAMKKSAPFEFRQEGDVAIIEFKNPEGLTADKPATGFRSGAKAAKPSTVGADDLAPALEAPPEVVVKNVSGAKVYKGRKVTLEFADAEVRKIFQLLSEVSNKNFVLGDDVTGNISIKLVNVPWDQALDIILDTKGLDKREEGNIIIIKGKGKFKSQAEEDLELKKQKYKALELVTESFSVNYADLPSVVTQFNALKSERGMITPDARTNKVFVKDIPIVIEEIRRLLAQVDVPERQVMIEARIIEATSTFTQSLGVNWGVHYRDGSASFLGINQLDTSFGGLTSIAAPTSGVSGLPGGAMGISFGTLTSNISLDLRLNAAASAGLIKIVSTPKVATLNNKSAKITQGQQVPYTTQTSDKIETKFVEAALSLEVTPHINANGTISMKIDAKNDSVGQAVGSSTAPAINKKQATTEMLLRDGETTVIGGIYVDSDNESNDGVPYLMDIPLVGKLFKSNTKTKVKTELLIFITPRILTTL